MKMTWDINESFDFYQAYFALFLFIEVNSIPHYN